MAELSNREKDLFLAALDMPADERGAFVAGACGADEPLRKQVEAMLKAHEQADSFLEKPPLWRKGALEPATELAPGDLEQAIGTHIGPYKLLQQIGEGGMGVVYMAQQQEPVSRYVALKIIKPGLDNTQVAARLEAERQALALMDHPNIARVFDAGATEDGRPYLVMELVKGTTITKFCDERRLSPRERLELFVPVCRAVQHAHQKGIIHRDLKPSNVLIALYDGKPVPKVIDFGIVKATGQRLTESTLFTQFGSILGTLEYMSPEQAEANQMDVDTLSDIYSLGVMLYELLTGSTPLSRERLKSAALLQVLMMIREEEPPSPSVRINQSGSELASLSQQRQTEPARLSSLFRGDVDGIVMKSLDKDRNRRYETAAGLAQDIERYLADEPIQARPPSAMYRFSKFVRRNRGVVLAASLLLGALIFGVIGTTIGMLVAIEAEHSAERARDDAVQARDEANTNKLIADGLKNQAIQNAAEHLRLKNLADENVLIADGLKNQAIQDAAEAVRLKNLADANAMAAKFQALRADTGRYANQLKSIQSAWQRDDLHTASKMLDDLPKEYRGTLEVRFLRAQCLRRARPSVGPNDSAAGEDHPRTFSPDGKTVVWMDGLVPGVQKSQWSMLVSDTVSKRTWKATGEVGRQPGMPAFDPTGRFLAVVDQLPDSSERRLTIWNAETGAKIRSVSCPSAGYPFNNEDSSVVMKKPVKKEDKEGLPYWTIGNLLTHGP
jgi:serine/threonine protein kinase